MHCPNLSGVFIHTCIKYLLKEAKQPIPEHPELPGITATLWRFKPLPAWSFCFALPEVLQGRSFPKSRCLSKFSARSPKLLCDGNSAASEGEKNRSNSLCSCSSQLGKPENRAPANSPLGLPWSGVHWDEAAQSNFPLHGQQ